MARKILLADESVTVQKAVEATLEPKGLEVLSVSSGNEAIQEAKRAHPDMILMDSDLPEGDGYEVCRQIKEDPELRGIPVILLTGEGEPYEESRAQQVGADGHLVKPFQGKDLLDQVLSFIDMGIDTGPIETEELEGLDLGEDLEGFEFEELGAEGGAVLDLTEAMEPLELEGEEEAAEIAETLEEFTFEDEGELDLEAAEDRPEPALDLEAAEEIEEFSFEEELEDLDLGDIELEESEEALSLDEDLGTVDELGPAKGMKETEEVDLGVDLDEALSLGEEELPPEMDLAGASDEEEESTLELDEDVAEEIQKAAFEEDLLDTSIEFATDEEGPSLEEELIAEEEAPLGDEGLTLEETAIEWEDLEGVAEETFLEGPPEEEIELPGKRTAITQTDITETFEEGPSLEEELIAEEEAPLGDERLTLEETAIEWEDLEEVAEEISQQVEAADTGIQEMEDLAEEISLPEEERVITETYEEGPEAAPPAEGAEMLDEVELVEEELPSVATEEEAVPEGLDQVKFQELSLDSVPSLEAGLHIELTEEDFGVVDPFSEEGIKKELARNLPEIVERVLSDMAPSIVERVARDIALEQTEKIVREEIERLKT